jgi:uncharacterized protein (TIGR03437 family)
LSFLLAIAVLSQAQLLTTDDGSSVFFTSASRMAGTDQSFRSKLFSWHRAEGIRLVYEAEGDVVLMSASGDGTLATIRVVCGSCEVTERSYVLYTATRTLEPLSKPAAMSRNGRFLFDGETLTDRATGAVRRYGTTALQFAVGNDGSVLCKTRDTFQRIDSAGASRTISTGARFANLGDVDENAITALVTNPGQTVLLDAISGEIRPVPTLAHLSGNGQWVASVARSQPEYVPQVQICRTNGTDCKLLTTPPITAYPSAVSQHGEIVFAAYGGAVLRIETATGRTEQPFILPSVRPEQSPPFVPGSLARLVSDNPGTLATVNGQAVPVLGRESRAIFVQIPWEVTDSVWFTMAGDELPFETSSQTYPLTDYNPQAVAPMDKGPLENSAYRQDWTATTYESPARPGEILHAIVTGLGPVRCAVRTNEPAPMDVLCPITRKVDWRWYPSERPADVLFVGLAPGLTGLYQIDVRVPEDAATGFMALSDGAGHPRIVWIRVAQ